MSSETKTAGASPGPPQKANHVGWIFLAIGLVLVTSTAVGGWIFFKRQQRAAVQTAQHTVSAVAELKAGQIANWMRERRGDAEPSLDYPLARQFLAEPGNVRLRQQLLRWMAVVQASYDYGEVALFDAGGALRLVVPGNKPLVAGD